MGESSPTITKGLRLYIMIYIDYLDRLHKGRIKVDVTELNELQLVCYLDSLFGWSHMLVSKPDSYIGMVLSHVGFHTIYMLFIFLW